VAARFIAPEPSVAARITAPAPSVAARFIAPAPPEPSTWTHLESPRPLTIRGRQLGFTELGATDGRLTGRRADGPFALRGPTLVVHYASWCLPCVAELPEVLTLARALADISTNEILPNNDISKSKVYSPKPGKARPRRTPSIVFVSHDEATGPQALLASFEALLAKARLTPADLPPGLSLRADPEGRFFAALSRDRLPIPDPSALPSLWLLDHRGRLHAHLSGPLTAEHRATLVAPVEALR
jgi:thiol-disulfide isomerase/thioredoxin